MLDEAWGPKAWAASAEKRRRRPVFDAAIERDKRVIDHLDRNGSMDAAPERVADRTGVPAEHIEDMVDRGVLRSELDGTVTKSSELRDAQMHDEARRTGMEYREPQPHKNPVAKFLDVGISPLPADRVEHYLRSTYSRSNPQLGEAKAEGAQTTKWDRMEEDELRKHIAKFRTMGEEAPAVPMLRATQALARKLALKESWEQWDLHRKLGGYSGMKSGPWGDGKDSPGRGPTGKLRNFKSMSDSKLHATVGALQIHGEDHEAHEAAQTEWAKRHPRVQKAKQLPI